MFDASQIDSTEQQGELLGCDFDFVRSRFFSDQVGWELKGAAFESLVPNRQAIAVPVQDLQPIAVPISKDEQMPTQWILLNDCRDHAGQPVK